MYARIVPKMPEVWLDGYVRVGPRTKVTLLFRGEEIISTKSAVIADSIRKRETVTFNIGSFNVITFEKDSPRKTPRRIPEEKTITPTQTEPANLPLPTPVGVSAIIDLTDSPTPPHSQPAQPAVSASSAPPPSSSDSDSPPNINQLSQPYLLPPDNDWSLPPPTVTPNRLDIMSTPPDSQIPNFSPANSQEMAILSHFHESPETPRLCPTPPILTYNRDTRHPQHMPSPVKPNAKTRTRTPLPLAPPPPTPTPNATPATTAPSTQPPN